MLSHKNFHALFQNFQNLVERAVKYDRAQHERTIRLMQVQRRGPYGTVGPGVALPVIAGAFKPLFEAIQSLYKTAGAFIGGLLEGFTEAVSEDQARQLSERLLESAILNIVFPPVFLSGAVVGIVEDVVNTVRGIKDLIVNFREMASAALELVKALFSSEGLQVAYQLGHEIGKSFADRITFMLKGNIFRFTYELGKFIGPTIIYTVLSFFGIPELLAASIVTRLMAILRPFLQRFPRFLRIAEWIAKRLAKRRHGPHIDPDIDRAVERGITEEATSIDRPARRPRPQAPSTTGRAEAARVRFDTLRNGYAERLGVGSGGQVHHAIELQALDRYPGAFAEAELNSFSNMRGIATEQANRRQLHNSKIREIWDRHYRRIDEEIAQRGLQPGTSAYNAYVRDALTHSRDEIDYVLGQFFTEYRTGRPRSFQ